MASANDFLLTAEELRLRGRKRRLVLLAIGSIFLLGIAGFFGARPAQNAIKGWQARRHAHKAFDSIQQEKWAEARDEAIAAYQLRQTEPEALRAVARFLSRTRQSQALDFWAQLAKVSPLTRADLRDEAVIALAANEGGRASGAIGKLLDNFDGGPSAADWILAAQLALQKNVHDEALAFTAKVFADRRTTEEQEFQAAYLEIAASVPDDSERTRAARSDARSRLKKLAGSPTHTGLDALTLLARLALSSPAGSNDAALPAADLIHALEAHPLAKAQGKFLALDLALHEQPSERAAIIERAIAAWKDSEPASLVVLATWLNGKGEFERELATIPLEKALRTRELFLQHVDALAALGRWEEIKGLLESERFPLDQVVQQMYLARCSAQLGEKAATANHWHAALEAASGDAQKLMALADYAEKNGSTETAEAAFNVAARQVPGFRPAQQGRLRLAQTRGDLRTMHAILAEMRTLWPNESAIENDEAYTHLLLMGDRAGGTGAVPSASPDLAQIEQAAADLVKREPSSLPHRTLLALARLRQNHPAEALRAYDQITVAAHALTPGALAVHAAVLAANGHDADARTEAAHIPLDALLPEERALVASLAP